MGMFGTTVTGFCSELDKNEVKKLPPELSDFYEYLPRGSLEEIMHGGKEQKDTFDWNEIYKTSQASVHGWEPERADRKKSNNEGVAQRAIAKPSPQNLRASSLSAQQPSSLEAAASPSVRAPPDRFNPSSLHTPPVA
ncbi:hypothetical protein FCM35_KLT15267 [Carex littledalei]|uniref:Uncharacterized protein n=1 Tax=Carex littledalei TaxID=544730 RepID=A0A833QHY8_9POAL|nr:hypothetical protein FCM35_KLT15267 [Carex littledalei]